ncbi:MAG TPA: M3 family oligoendopeptidase [Ktedonobacterales bacterium]|nr:M3 family oligoendopeptidase [Ktedonobacterales bacterium]
MSTASTLPHWDISTIFPSLESPEFAAGFAAVVRRVDDLAALFDELRIERPAAPTPADEATVAAVERAITALNDTLAPYRTLSSYIYSFVATDSRNALAQARQSELQRQSVRLSQLRTRFTAWIGALDVEGVITHSQVAREHAFTLREAKTLSARQMSPEEEALASELNVSGGAAWAKLHATLTSQIAATVALDGGPREMSMSMLRNLAFNHDRAIRRKGYEAELAAWERNAAPLAAALNSIKGQVNTLTRKRGWASPLDAALFDARIDRATLDAMLTAARESFPDWRRYMRAKARALGLERLAWYDLFAPVGGSGRPWSFAEGEAFVTQRFGAYSERLSAFAARAFQQRWIDAEPRPGKEDGAFCMPIWRDESRVMANFKPSFDGVSTIAHELGHGYHNMLISARTMLQRETPMTLAETASIFCETIIKHAALADAQPDEQIELLEASLQGQCQVVVDITSRFLFEQAVFEQRRERELSIQEFCDLMVQAQRDTYGDGLDETAPHPYMWAVKSHYYSPSRSFYNFPYMFGLLFGLGLYARYQQDPDGFRERYDDLLGSTGLADAATLAARFGIDTRSADFWSASLDVIRADIIRFETLVAQRA